MKALPSFEMAGITHPMIQYHPSTLVSSAAAAALLTLPHLSNFHTDCNTKFHRNNMSSRPGNETWVKSYSLHDLIIMQSMVMQNAQKPH